MIEFKSSMKKEELLEIAAKNGVAADDGMTKTQIIDALTAHNEKEAAERAAEGATEGAGSDAPGGGTDDTTPSEKPAETPAEDEEGGGSGTGNGGGETPPDGATEGGEDGAGDGGTDDTTPGGKPAETPTEGGEGYDTFIYVGPSIPRGRLKENAVFRGTFSDVLKYLGDVVEQYPQIPRLIVPTNRLAAFSVKVKTTGNIAHKYYSDIASAIRRGKEV